MYKKYNSGRFGGKILLEFLRSLKMLPNDDNLCMKDHLMVVLFDLRNFAAVPPSPILLTRLDSMIREEIELTIDESFYWTDSMCVFRYIENEEKRFQTFVANRVAAIRERSLPTQWKYVESKLNPADDASRGLEVDAVVDSNRWTKGPDFLWQSEEMWPVRPVAMDPERDQECDLEEKKTTLVCFARRESARISEIFERFSSWLQL